jgi:metal-responsive CopG/Arc/MetJ family transcriptional regulator
MRTTISIDEALVDELMRAEPNVSRSEALRRAVKSHLRSKRLDAFMTLAGSRLVDVSWQEMERIELEAAERQPRDRHGRTRRRPR